MSPRIDRRPEGGAINKALRHSALAQYIASQLKLQPAAAIASVKGILHSGEKKVTPSPEPRSMSPEALAAVTDAFFDRIAPLQSKARLIVVIDGRRSLGAISPDDAGFVAERRAFMEAARRWGAGVADAEVVFRPHLERSRRALEVGPFDRHLNAVGIGMLMAAAASRLP